MKLRIGTRGSPLAVAQTRQVATVLEASCDRLEVEIVRVSTTGDRVRDRPLRDCGGKGLFVRELDEALLGGDIDCAVHSLKDVPSELPEGVALAAVPRRANPSDLLISLGGHSLEGLPPRAVVGTTSPRRAAQLLAVRGDLRIELLRGNVGTRLKRLISGDFDATLLARAGIERLGVNIAPAHAVVLDPRRFVPSPGQGAIGLTARLDDSRRRELLESIQDASSRACVDAERSLAASLGGSCYLPVGAYCEEDGDEVRLWGLVVSPDGKMVVRDQETGSRGEAFELGYGLGRRLLDAGGEEILAVLEMPR
ncbi:MAG: hydroxymethylbilane synthase [Candidatus Binatia bacterium]